jgi:hypothetical protein
MVFYKFNRLYNIEYDKKMIMNDKEGKFSKLEVVTCLKMFPNIFSRETGENHNEFKVVTSQWKVLLSP